MPVLVGMLIGGVAAGLVRSDARALERRGIEVGLTSPAGWAVRTFLLAVFAVPAYLMHRREALEASWG